MIDINDNRRRLSAASDFRRPKCNIGLEMKQPDACISKCLGIGGKIIETYLK